MHDSVSDPLTFALRAVKIFKSYVSFASAVNHMSSTPVLGEEFPVHAVHFPAAPCAPVLPLLVPVFVTLLLLPQPLVTQPLPLYADITDPMEN